MTASRIVADCVRSYVIGQSAPSSAQQHAVQHMYECFHSNVQRLTPLSGFQKSAAQPVVTRIGDYSYKELQLVQLTQPRIAQPSLVHQHRIHTE